MGLQQDHQLFTALKKKLIWLEYTIYQMLSIELMQFLGHHVASSTEEIIIADYNFLMVLRL